MEWAFLKENMLTESKRVQCSYGTERGRGGLEIIIMNNYDVPVIGPGGGGMRMTSAQMLPRKFVQM